jgi:hypothetical protein
MRVRRLLTGLGLATVIAAASASAVAASAPIGPHQHFEGVVNGARDDATVDTVCPGPAGGDRTGPVAGNQKWWVARVAGGDGDTGPFSQVYAWFVPAQASAAQPVQVRFDSYGVRKAIPTKIQVPCTGTGTVEFSSCPYLAPCAAGWVPDYVTVHFVDIAA